MKALGRHILVEFLNCKADVLNDVAAIENAMVEAAQIAGATVINSTFHHFSPYGVSGVVVIQESHLAIHTWPEYRYAAVDLFTCGDTVDPWVSFEHLKKSFEASYSALEMNRGSTHVLKKGNEIQVKPNDTENYDPKKGYKINRNVWFTDKDDNQALSLRYTGEVLFDERNEFQRVRILDSISYGKMLAIDDMVMCTERDEYHYHEMITHPAMQAYESASGKTAKNVLVIGGGDGGTIREICKYPGLEKVTMVEIDEAVVRACKQFLLAIARDYFSNPKVNLIIGDGIKFISESPADVYDLVIVDGSDPAGPAEGLFTNEFYSNCKKAMKQNGILVTQGESPMFHSETFVELSKCLKTVFSPSQVHTMLFHAPTYPSGMWSLQMAIKGQYHPVTDFDKAAAAQFAKAKDLRYYNEDLHSAAFALPTFVKNMLNT